MLQKRAHVWSESGSSYRTVPGTMGLHVLPVCKENNIMHCWGFTVPTSRDIPTQQESDVVLRHSRAPVQVPRSTTEMPVAVSPSIKDRNVSSVPPEGTWVWVHDPEYVWRKARFISRSDNPPNSYQFCYENESDPVFLPAGTTTYLCNEDAVTKISNLDDLTQLTHLHEPALLHALDCRFALDRIYTLTGPILIAVNPFKSLPSLYNFATTREYLESTEHDVPKKQRPHVFAIASAAYRSLCRSQRAQTVLISGESGAGKTESTKFVMKLLALAGSENWTSHSQVERQVLQSNPLLESLGNAKTLRNHNSSRFGKFIEMQFIFLPKPGQELLTGRLAGARIHTYLLETVRVCQQMEGERNYHIFYQLCAAAASVIDVPDHQYHFPQVISEPEAVRCSFDLSAFKPFDQFRYLTKSSCHQLERINDLEEFEYTVLAMQTIGIPLEDQLNLFNTLGAVLNLGNLLFEPLTGDSEASAVCETCGAILQAVAAFLHLPSASLLEKALTYRTIVAAGDTYTKSLLVKEAEDNRDALARALYGTLFRKFVKDTNESIGYDPMIRLFCGVLDIFGFECFQLNSFEQLCINYTNERLQQFFNTFIFKCEQQLYAEEGVGWNASDFPDNQDCVDLLEQKTAGIFSMLDEECVVPRGNDHGLVHKLKEKHKANKRFGIIKVQPDWFVIHHFAGPVPYCIDGFVEKNRDQLSQDLQNVIRDSRHPFVSSLFTDFLERGQKTGGRKRLVTVSSEFRQQLDHLMDSLAATDPHFIRCIKPNPLNSPDAFDRIAVTEQLRYGGVLQAVEVSRAGYPVRLSHRDALLDYRPLADDAVRREIQTFLVPLQGTSELKSAVQLLFDHLDKKLQLPNPAYSSKGWSIGASLVFFKQDVYTVLSEKRALQRSAMATTILRYWLGLLQRRYYLHLKACSLVIQTFYRQRLAAKKVQRLREDRAARHLQNAARGYIVRRRFKRLRNAVVALQALCRARHAMQQNASRLQQIMAVRLQTAWRRYAAQNVYNQLRRATLLAQRRWRVLLAKHKLRQLRSEQRETATLLALQQQLKNENAVLKQKIDMVTNALRNVEHEKVVLEERLIEAEAIASSLSPLRTPGMMKHAADDATRVPSMIATSPSSVDLSDTSRSPFRRVTQVLQVNLPAQQPLCDSSDDVTPTAATLERCRLEPVVVSPTVEETVERLNKALQKQSSCVAAVRQKYCGTGKGNALVSSPVSSVIADVPRPTRSDVSARSLAFDVLVLAHADAGVGKLLNPNNTAGTSEPSIVLLQQATLPEGSLCVYRFTVDRRAWVVGYVDLSSAMVSSRRGCSEALFQWIGASRYIFVAYSAQAIASCYAAEWCADILEASTHPTSAKLDVRFWRTSAFTSTDPVLKCAAHLQAPIIENTKFLTLLRSLSLCDAFSYERREAGAAHVLQHQRCAMTPKEKEIRRQVAGLEEYSSEILAQVLRPSFDGVSNESGSCTKPQAPTSPLVGSLRPVVELFTQPASRVSCLVFTQRHYGTLAPYYLLAVGCFDGSLYLYRIFLTKDEVQLDSASHLVPSSTQNASSLRQRTTTTPPYLDRVRDSQLVELHWKEVHAHKQPITALAFSETEPVLGSSSLDGSIRFWGIHTGANVKNFQDACPCTTFAMVPLYPSRFVLGNAKGTLRLVEGSTGAILQRLHFSTAIRSVTFDSSGQFCFAGTQLGTLLVFCLSHPDGRLELLFQAAVAKGALTSLAYVPSRAELPPRLMVDAGDETFIVLDCGVNDVAGKPHLRLKLRHQFLGSALGRSCYSNAGLGWFITPLRDGYMAVISAGTPYRSTLEYHKNPVTSTATNRINTVLASGDESGHVVLWRWVLESSAV